jgi:hypothetical protein
MSRSTRAQVEHPTGVGASSGADIELEVGAEATRANFQEAPLPIWALGPGPDRADEYMVMRERDGVLSNMEVAGTGDAAPSEMPAAQALTVARWEDVPGGSYRVLRPLDRE